MTDIIPDQRSEFIAGLLQFADFLEATPSVPCTIDQRFLLPMSTNTAVEEFAAAHGLVVEYDDAGNANADLQFGPITYRAYGYVDFDAHYARRQEEQARTWAASHGLALRPAEGGAA
ncbi:hypothetical protein DMA15_17460 [Streptomyces sp. WAC 01529]|uniref:hypothetical protein n=1 Tax=Streptomyces sp. WAC 01529 TaxID=2203205 RepID=UPI000F6BF34B|nr:hypothetical protein [Streptomyces sp. WAC 01529]AZM54136.1 hypothetical protein DMA15_17460 [Streptomyces sp. WAC 01529]